jgi:sialic acid synthase SpsE
MTYIIAEGGVAHEGTLEGAKMLLNMATQIDAHADCFKLQYFEKGMRGPNRELPWLYPDEMVEIDLICQDNLSLFLVTPHDRWAMDIVYDLLKHRTVKIGSGDWHLLDKAQEMFDEVIVSTGMKTMPDMGQLYNRPPHTVLHCVSEYPTPASRTNLPMIGRLRAMFPKSRVGYSDHTVGTIACIAAVTLGAEVIEKHITLERNIKGRQDTFCSLIGNELGQMIRDIRRLNAMMVSQPKGITTEEQVTLDWVQDRLAD